MPVSFKGSPIPKPNKKQTKKKAPKVDPENLPPMLMERPTTPTRSAGPTPEFDDLMQRLRFFSVSVAPWEHHHRNLEEAVENDDTVSTLASDYTPSIDDCRVFGKVAGDNALEKDVVQSPNASPVASAFSSPASEAQPKTTPISSPLSSPAEDQSKKSPTSSPSSPAPASKAAGPSKLPRLSQAFGSSNVPLKIFVETESAKKRWTAHLAAQKNNATSSIHPQAYLCTKPSAISQFTEATIASLRERRCFFTKEEEELLKQNIHLLGENNVPGGFSLRAANFMNIGMTKN